MNEHFPFYDNVAEKTHLFYSVTHNVLLTSCRCSSTYHHLVYGVHNVVHLVPGDEAVIVHIIQSECPWNTTSWLKHWQVASVVFARGRNNLPPYRIQH